MQESDSNARDNAESKSSTDVETCDKTIDTNAPDSLSEEIPNIENKNIDEYGGGTTTRARDSHTLEIKPPIQFVPTPKITTSKEFNNNLPEYVIVTDNLSKPGLVVLDSGDNDEGDKISIINNNLNIMTTDRTVLQMSHHRWIIIIFYLSLSLRWYQVGSEADDQPPSGRKAERHQAQGQGEDCPQGTQDAPQLLVRLIPVIQPVDTQHTLCYNVIHFDTTRRNSQ